MWITLITALPKQKTPQGSRFLLTKTIASIFVDRRPLSSNTLSYYHLAATHHQARPTTTSTITMVQTQAVVDIKFIVNDCFLTANFDLCFYSMLLKIVRQPFDRHCEAPPRSKVAAPKQSRDNSTNVSHGTGSPRPLLGLAMTYLFAKTTRSASLNFSVPHHHKFVSCRILRHIRDKFLLSPPARE